MRQAFIQKSGDGPVESPADGFEPAFFDPGARLCPRFPSAEHAERYLDYLAHLTARRPANLKAHVQRILLAIEWRRAETLERAFRDLFHTLRQRGQKLCEHLLDLAAGALSPQELASLRTLRHAAAAPSAKKEFIRRIDPELSQVRRVQGAMSEALDYMIAGQVDQAVGILEGIVGREPQNVAAVRTLIELYTRAGNRPALLALRERVEPLTAEMQRLFDLAFERIAS
jgi:hypothetical protein